MADRYWVGGTGDWADTAHWSTTSGGAGGAAVPTYSDDVYLDQNSSTSNAAYTATLHGICKNLTIDGPSPTDATKVTLTGSYQTTMAGNLDLIGGTSGITNNYTGIIQMANNNWLPTITIETHGVHIKSLWLNKISTEFKLLNHMLYIDTLLKIDSGYLNTNGQNVYYTYNSAATLTIGGNNLFDSLYITKNTNCAVNFTGSNTFGYIQISTNYPYSLVFSSGTTQTLTSSSSFGIEGIYYGTTRQIVTITSDTTGTHTLSCSTGNIETWGLNIQHSIATGGANWYAGDSVDNNSIADAGSGWIFGVPLTNPGNVYISDDTYATCTTYDGTSSSGNISIQISIDGGANWSTVKTNTLSNGAAEAYYTYGGTADNWGISMTGADINSATDFIVRLKCGYRKLYQNDFSGFGFAESATSSVLGLKIEVEAKYIATGPSTPSIYVDHLRVTATMSDGSTIIEGSTAYDSTLNTLTTYNGTTWDVVAKTTDIPVKISGSTLDALTDDTGFVTAKSIQDGHKVPHAAIGTTGNVLTDNGTDWVSSAPIGSVSITSNEVPSGAVNSSNVNFTTVAGYVSGSLEVYINGLKQALTTHFTETTPASGTFAMGDAPLTGDIITVSYQTAASATGNADTLDNYHATGLWQLIYPVGCIYESTVITSPATLFGGTWATLGAGRVLVGKAASGTFATAGATGGAETVAGDPHTHPLSNAGAAKITISAVAEPNVFMNRVGGFSWKATHNGGVGTVAGSTAAGTSGAGLMGATDSESPAATSVLQPYLVVYRWNRTA